MTPSELNVLKALDAAPNKTAAWRDLHRASGCKTTVGFRRVLLRMINDSLVARADLHGLDMVITFGGLRAWKSAHGKCPRCGEDSLPIRATGSDNALCDECLGDHLDATGDDA